MQFPKQSRYGVKRIQVDGIWYDSQLERDYHQVLLFMQRAGEISDLEYHQETVYLTESRIGYKPDFTYTEKGRKVWVDTKGVETEIFRLKMRLWRCYGPGPLRIVKRSGNGFKTTKEIMSKHGERSE